MGENTSETNPKKKRGRPSKNHVVKSFIESLAKKMGKSPDEIRKTSVKDLAAEARSKKLCPHPKKASNHDTSDPACKLTHFHDSHARVKHIRDSPGAGYRLWSKYLG